MDNQIQTLTFNMLPMTIGVLPSSYVDSMSYYETLLWLCNYLENTVIPTVNNNGEAVEELQSAYITLHDYVEHYFDNLDVQTEINNKLDQMAEDGTLTNLIKAYVDPIYEAYESEINGQISDIKDDFDDLDETLNARIDTIDAKVESATSGSPLVASSTDEMTDTSRVYVNTTDGKWYYYDGDSWEIGGTYQATEIADKSITAPKYKSITPQSYNLFDKQLFHTGYISSTGVVNDNQTSGSGLNRYTDFMPVDRSYSTHIIATTRVNYCFYDSSKTFISGTTICNATYVMDIPVNTAYVRCSYIDTDVNNLMIINSDKIPPFKKYQYSIDEVITPTDNLFYKDKLSNDILSSYNIYENIVDPNKIYDGVFDSNGYLTAVSGSYIEPVYTDMYSVEGNTDYYFGNPGGTYYACFYDSSKNWISRVSLSNAITTTPATANYVRLIVEKSRVKNIAIIKTSQIKSIPYEFSLDGLKIARKYPTIIDNPLNVFEADYDYLLSCRSQSTYVTETIDSYNKHIINLNPEVDHDSSTYLEYFMIAKSKCIEIEFDSKATIGEDSDALVSINCYNASKVSQSSYSGYNRYIHLQNSEWKHKKIRYMIPEFTPYIRVVFVAYAGSSLHVKNIHFKFVDKATNTNNANLKFWGHQGMNSYAPKNTIPSFEYAIAGGMDSCVINVNYTSDGYIVCLHDDTIDATSSGSGNIHEMSYSEALQYDFGSWFDSYYTGTKIPLLNDVLDLFAKNGVTPIIRWNDSLTGTNKAKVFELLVTHGFLNKAKIIGFSISTLLSLHEDYPNFIYGYCGYDEADSTLINKIKQLGDGAFYDCDHTSLTEEIVNTMHENDIKVGAWFINSFNDLHNAYDLGVDFIKSDFYAYQNCDF